MFLSVQAWAQPLDWFPSSDGPGSCVSVVYPWTLPSQHLLTLGSALLPLLGTPHLLGMCHVHLTPCGQEQPS